MAWFAASTGSGGARTYARTGDEAVMPWFRWALRVARLEALTPPARQLYEAIAADQEWANRFCGLNAETVDPDTFFSGA